MLPRRSLKSSPPYGLLPVEADAVANAFCVRGHIYEELECGTETFAKVYPFVSIAESESTAIGRYSIGTAQGASQANGDGAVTYVRTLVNKAGDFLRSQSSSSARIEG